MLSAFLRARGLPPGWEQGTHSFDFLGAGSPRKGRSNEALAGLKETGQVGGLGSS